MANRATSGRLAARSEISISNNVGPTVFIDFLVEVFRQNSPVRSIARTTDVLILDTKKYEAPCSDCDSIASLSDIRVSRGRGMPAR
jgi:hypothetical protein